MNNNRQIILGIETSCDDTSAAIVTSDGEILSNVVLSQVAEHQLYQGVVPEIASRAHMNYLEFAIEKALSDASITIDQVNIIASTGGPGLIGGVIVGTMFGKTLSSILSIPYISVNHLEGHALTVRLTDKIQFPYLLLLISGGHCQFISVKNIGEYKILGRTLDDAAGEAFDKLSKMLNLGYPGGPIIEQMAIKGNKNAFKLPKSMAGREGCDMSFSGLKTSVRKIILDEKEKLGILSESFIHDICASFQNIIAEILKDRMANAIKLYEQESSNKIFVISGGVAANKYLNLAIKEYLDNIDYKIFSPPLKLCTDNAAMIAWAGYENWSRGNISNLNFCPKARWSLEDIKS